MSYNLKCLASLAALPSLLSVNKSVKNCHVRAVSHPSKVFWEMQIVQSVVGQECASQPIHPTNQLQIAAWKLQHKVDFLNQTSVNTRIPSLRLFQEFLKKKVFTEGQRLSIASNSSCNLSRPFGNLVISYIRPWSPDSAKFFGFYAKLKAENAEPIKFAL